MALSPLEFHFPSVRSDDEEANMIEAAFDKKLKRISSVTSKSNVVELIWPQLVSESIAEEVAARYMDAGWHPVTYELDNFIRVTRFTLEYQT